MRKIYFNIVALVCILLASTTNLEFMAGHTHTLTDTQKLPDLSVAAFENPFCGNMQLHVMFGPFWLPPRFAFISAVAAVAAASTKKIFKFVQRAAKLRKIVIHCVRVCVCGECVYVYLYILFSCCRLKHYKQIEFGLAYAVAAWPRPSSTGSP